MMAARLKLISEHLHAMASWHEASKKSRVGSATGEDAARDTVSSASASAAAADSANHSATSVSIRPCRVAIIGLGRQGSTICSEQPAGSPPFSIAGACHASSKLELVAGCDLLPAKREAFTQLWGCKDVYADFAQMITSVKPDLVAICTAACVPKPTTFWPADAGRPDAHADLCCAVAAMGVPLIFCEKAIASSMEACDRIKSMFHKYGTRLATGQFRRFDNRFVACGQAIAAGEIGPPTAAVFFGSSSLLHGHIHTIDTLSFLLGDPGIRRVRGELTDGDGKPLAVEGDHIPADPTSTYQIQFMNGVVATAVPSGKGAAYEFEVIGPAGTLRTWYQLASDVVDDGPAGTASAGASLRRHGAFSRPGQHFAYPARGKQNLRSGDSTAGRDNGDYVWQDADGPWAHVRLKSATVTALEDLVDARAEQRKACGDIDIIHANTEATFAVAVSHRRGGGWVDLPLRAEDRRLYVFHV